MKVTVQFLAVAFSYFSGLSFAALRDINATNPDNLAYFNPNTDVGYQLRETFTDLTHPDHVDRFVALVKLVSDKIDDIGSLTVTDINNLHELGLALLFIKKHINSGRDFSGILATFNTDTEVLYQAGLRAMENFYDYHKQQNHIAALYPEERLMHSCLLLTKTATCMEVTIDDITDYNLIAPSDQDLKDFKDNVMQTVIDVLDVDPVTRERLRGLIDSASSQIAVFDNSWKTYKSHISIIWDDELFNYVVRYTLQPGVDMDALYQDAASRIDHDHEIFENFNFLSLIADLIPDDTEKQTVKLRLKQLAFLARHMLKRALLQEITNATTADEKYECIRLLYLMYMGNVHGDILSNLEGVFTTRLDISAAENLQFRNFIDDYYQNDANHIQAFDEMVQESQFPVVITSDTARASPVQPPIKVPQPPPEDENIPQPPPEDENTPQPPSEDENIPQPPPEDENIIRNPRDDPVDNDTTVIRFISDYRDMPSTVNETAKAPEEATERSKKAEEETKAQGKDVTKTKVGQGEKAEVGGKPMGNGMKIAIGAGVVVAVVAVAAAGYYFLAV